MFTFAVVAGYFMLVWYRTNAFAEYAKLFRLDNFFAVAEYLKIHKDGYDGNYIDFLSEYYSDFFVVRLLRCPVCVSFWLGVVSVFAFESVDAFLAAPLTLFFYLLFNRML
jgi:hypothetical protein